MPSTTAQPGPEQRGAASFVVRGRVTTAVGAASGLEVRAYDRRLRTTDLLGTARTGADGSYQITYPPPARAGILVVRVFTGDAGLLGESPIQPRIGDDAVVDVVVGAPDLSEFERVSAAVQPELDGAALADLAEDDDRTDISQLSSLTGHDPTRIAELVLAHRHAAVTGLPATMFFGMLREGLPRALSALASFPVDGLRTAVQAAARDGVIPEIDDGQITQMITRLRRLQLAHLVGAPANQASPPLPKIVADVVPDAALRARLWTRFLDHPGPPGELWRTLREDPELEAGLIARLQRALQLATLTGNNPPLVAHLLERFDNGELTTLGDLAWFSEAEWQAMVTGSGGAPDGGPARDREYAADLFTLIVDAHPTRQIARRFQDDPALRDTPAARFLRAHPEFDLVRSSVKTAVAGHSDAQADPEALVRELGEMQRVFKIAPDFDAMQTLRAAGIASAAQVAQMGRTAFTRSFGAALGEPQAAAIHDRAAQTHAAAAHLIAAHHAFNQVPMAALNQVASPSPAIPDWELLFGSEDYCACSDCGSVFGLAAYLTDLLHFLKTRQDAAGPYPTTKKPIMPVRDVLLSRRPDLAELELSCDNTNLVLPYIDVVNEILERAVAPTAIDWSKPLTAEARASLQSTGTPAELRATPQHLTPAAYTTLAGTPYPWDLPFDLWGEQTRTFLRHLGVARHDLMAAFAVPTSAGPVPSDLDVVTEYLGMSPAQRKLITGETTTSPMSLAECYGLPAGTADLVTPLQQVRSFLDVTGLSHADLVALLQARFVNPGGTLTQISTDPAHPDTCDTTKLSIDKLDPAALDRIHRFVRLYGALGWSARQLDRALSALVPAAPTLNTDTIQQLATLRWMMARTGLGLEWLLVLYAPLDTDDRYAPDDPPLYDRLFLDPTVTTLPPQLNPLRLTPDRTQVDPPTGATLDDPTIAAVVLSALGITQNDLAVLVGGPRKVVTDTTVNLANLTALTRNVTLARALQLSIVDFLRLVELSGIQPFPGTGEPPTADVVARTRTFVEMLDKLSAGRLTPAEADAVLTATVDLTAPAIPDAAAVASILADLRAALAPIFAQTSAVSDDSGVVTRKQLSLLRWSPAVVDQAIGTLLGNATCTAPLTALPQEVVFPPELVGTVRYDSGRLSFAGAMTSVTLTTLQGLSTDQGYRAALQALFDAPRQFVTSRMGAFATPVVTTPLAALPTGLTIPPELSGIVFYDPNRSVLCATDYLSATDRSDLLALSSDSAWQAAVTSLITAQDTTPIAVANTFLTGADATNLFDGLHTPAERFALVLGKLQPHLRRTLATAVVQQKISDATRLDPATTEGLLIDGPRRSPGGPPLLEDLLDPAFVTSDPSVSPTPTAAPDQQSALSLLYRTALLLNRLAIGAQQLSWIASAAPDAGWLDPAAIPAAPAVPDPSTFGAFLRLLDLVQLRDTLPGDAALLGDLNTLARTTTVGLDEIVRILSARTGWNPDDTATLCGSDGFNLTVAAFADERALRRLQACFGLLRQLGVAATRAQRWSAAQLTEDDANAAWQSAKAAHTLADWNTVAGPLRDTSRDRQRSCLVSYLVAHPPTTPRGPAWTSTNDLYQYFLIDVDMGTCQLTSRIVLATNSVQLFLQRCLLNLEPDVPIAPDPPGTDAWADWSWMSKYRVWEANRRVFCYPENYLDPSLRPDKTDFFADLENALRQKDVTADAVDTAFRGYLDQLDAVARLQPCGIYRQYETGADGSVRVDVLHVFARDFATPHDYYYRQFVNGIRWTPWEAVGLDIQGDHLMPVIWKGRLYLVWPLFVQSANQSAITMPAAGAQLPNAPKQWQVQFAFSEYKSGKWLAKQLITNVISAPFGGFDPTSNGTGVDDQSHFLFLPDAEFVTDGQLSMACYKKHPDAGSLAAVSATVTLSPSKAVRTDDFNPTVTQTLGAAPANTSYVDMEYVETPTAPTGLGRPLMIPTDPLAPQSQHTLLAKTPGIVPFRILYPNHYDNYPTHPFVAAGPEDSFFFSDGVRSYFVIPNPPAVPQALRTPDAAFPDRHGLAHPAVANPVTQAGRAGNPTSPAAAVLTAPSALGASVSTGPIVPVRFTEFYHPFVEMLIRKVTDGGVSAMLDRDVQINPDTYTGGVPFSFSTTYGGPVTNVLASAGEEIDFDILSGYGIYNWELFFHAPLLLAQRLSANQRFSEAQDWFHTIFDPTDRSGGTAPQRFWRTKPLYTTSSATYADEQIANVLEQLAQATPPAGLSDLILDWRQNPFQPDLIARVRTTAYQKAVVMKYLDNLIAWADQLFRQYSMETITQATELYVLASELLGRRPEESMPKQVPAPLTYNELEANHLDAFSNALIGAEHLVPMQPAAPAAGASTPPTVPTLLYFCIPKNDKLLGYWDTVADRLYKIRNCLTIDGVPQQLSLTEAPVDIGQLVADVAAGADVGTALADINAALPGYRFTTMLAKASELAAELKSLGASLLAALEKRDAEALARLRSAEEIRALSAARDVRKQQVDEARAALAALAGSRVMIAAKQQYYAGRPFMNDGETAHTLLAAGAIDLQTHAAAIELTGNILGLIPDLKVGCPTTIGATFGGSSLVQALRAFSSALSATANIANAGGSLSATLGGYARRADDWGFQAAQAGMELAQIDQQIAAATIRESIAEKELANHDLQIANAREADAFMRTKYTNEELYDWMSSEVSTLFFQSYQLAYDIAKRAERAYQFELGVQDSAFIQFGCWDNLHKGLLAGELLYADLKRLDASYLELNQREYELTKRISLAALDPEALYELRLTGECYVTLPEAMFDLDTPGHYRRRLRSVAFTIPCVTGPYTNVTCTATLLRSSIRIDPALNAGAYRRTDDDRRFLDYVGSVQSVVTSSGLQDSGLFEPNLRDERYLPFEGYGAIGDWHFTLPTTFRQFDYDTITDLIMELRYTAREAGAPLADAVNNELQTAVNAWIVGPRQPGLLQAISARTGFPDAWNRFLNPLAGADQVLTLPLSRQQIPSTFRDRHVTVDRVQVLLVLSEARTGEGGPTYVDAYAAGPALPITVTPAGAPAHTGTLTSTSGVLAGTPTLAFPTTAALTDAPGDWAVSVARADVATVAAAIRTSDNLLSRAAVDDLVLLVHYTLA